MKRLLVLCFVLAALPAQAAGDLFVQANQDYAQQRYQAAAVKYEELIESGTQHATVHYNLGNTYFRLAEGGQENRIGRAILAYERALVLDPNLEDARYNLEVAREVVADRHGRDEIKGATAEPLWVRTVTWLPLSVASWLFLALNVVFFGVLIVVRFMATGLLRTGLVAGNAFIGVAGLLVGVLLGGQVYFLETVRTGIVVADEVVMREGPDATRREGPRLHAGHKARVLGDNHGWTRVRLANHYEGWVPEASIEEVLK